MLINNVDVKNLKNEYGTPLYIFDKGAMKNNISLYLNNFKSTKFETEVLFASKAFSIKKMIELIKNSNMSLDCVSLGELYTAKSVGFDMSKIYYHGNNKTPYELEQIVNENVGIIVVDNLMELEYLSSLSNKINKDIHFIVRLNLGIEAHTHKFIVTSHIDSKFGVLYQSADYKEMLKLISSNKHLILEGFHSHIGSQIFDLDAFKAALEKLLVIIKDFDYPMILNIGGGFGVNYTNEDKAIPLDIVCKTLIRACEEELALNNLKIKKLCIEPGRSIVAEAGYTLYTVGWIKNTPNKTYYFIDGGMTDNIRPALYQAKYAADIVGRENEPKDVTVTVAGKCCESGDLIIENYKMQKANPGDLMITYTTGAYGYSMSSNYNKALTPAVVFVENGQSELVVRRQTYEELLDREL